MYRRRNGQSAKENKLNDPYEVLGLSGEADEASVRQRYLELVRQFPPERDAERFAQIREAYDALRDPVRRMRARLFESRKHDSLDAIRTAVLKRLRTARIPTDTLLSLADTP